ncbi:Pimeloyl-ACP methyl ester carboxylesterase [Rhizobiales bacterium GAS191]|nr:Pimeloyl-ACP methyl ester carboxylesterase [Rhizobiales bacterium GAS191]
MTMRRAWVNGITIAYDIRGSGPPLILIMGYRLSSSAWPPDFIEALAKRFTLVSFDNRGTGLSDKPTCGYALSNMAKDVGGLMDHLGIESANVIGYSMGGAVAQELACHHPERVRSLVLCATLCGGPRAVYAHPAVISVMRDLDGLDPVAAARRIWTVTYEPAYLAANRDEVERQMHREIVSPTPLHAADLQFQAFVDFNSSQALSAVRSPTLIITGDRDELIPPRNSEILAELISGARLTILHGCAHRAIWESTSECVTLIGDFLQARDSANAASR